MVISHWSLVICSPFDRWNTELVEVLRASWLLVYKGRRTKDKGQGTNNEALLTFLNKFGSDGQDLRKSRLVRQVKDVVKMLDQQKRNCSPEEIEQAITELERYRERIVNDLFQSARRVDVSHKATMANIGKNPEILRIDAEIEKLQQQQAQLR